MVYFDNILSTLYACKYLTCVTIIYLIQLEGSLEDFFPVTKKIPSVNKYINKRVDAICYMPYFIVNI